MIKSLQNDKIKQLLKLSRYKKYRNDQNKFILEGLRLVVDAIKFNVTISQIFLTEKSLIKFKLKQIDLTKYKIHIIHENIANEISSVKQSQGCFAVASKLKNLNFDEISKNDNVLLLVRLNDPGNLGTLIRSAAAFNFKKIILADCCDFYNSKVIRSSMGAIFKINCLQCSCVTATNWLKNCKLNKFAAVVSCSAQNVSTIKKNVGNVLIIGSEAHGLSSDVLKCCNSQITIKMQNEIESLNAAVAGSILMFSLSTNLKNS